MIVRRLIGIAALLLAPPGEAATHRVVVNGDGSFSPSVVYIHSGDTVEWALSSPTDSIIPVDWDGVSSDLCSAVRPYRAGDANEFTGPMPQAPSGVFVLSPLEFGFIEQPSSTPCATGPPKTTAGSETLCRGGTKGATLDSTWEDSDNQGVFIRLLWKDVQIAPGTADSSFDFTVLDREVTKAVRNGKFFLLGIKAASDGTPEWLFDNGVTALRLQDSGSDGDEPGCGSRMTLGNPTEAAYQAHYFDLLRKVASRLKSRADWYRALAYIKPSGANLHTHENRLPKRCEAGCVCNSQLFAEHGYRPSGLYGFYQSQTNLIAGEFPGKTMAYALIQDGFPRISESGHYEQSDGTSSGGALPGGTEQTQVILNNGQASHGLLFAVQHNGLTAKKTDNCLASVNAPGCPNRWVLQEGLEGQITGWQTSNEEKVASPADVDASLQNALANSQGIFLELYEERFWESVRQPGRVIDPLGSGRTMAQWAAELHNVRRRLFPMLGDPQPQTHRHTFTRTLSNVAGNQTFYYIHGAKCGGGKAASVVVLPDGATPPAGRRRAVRP